MNYPLQRERIADGVHFSSIHDKKFKHNRLSVNFLVPLDREKTTTNAIVPYILRQGCAQCPDFTELNKKCCDLYGASLEAYVDSFGGYQILGMGIVGLDNRFALEDENLIDRCCELLACVVLEPHLPQGSFAQGETDLQKLFLIDTIEAEINDKRSYALHRCKGILFEGEAMAVKKYGYRDQAEKITPQSATAAYFEMLRTAQIEILFEGTGKPDSAKKLFAKRFEDCLKNINRKPVPVKPTCSKKQSGEVKQVTDRMDVTQGKLVMGFRVEGCESYKQMNAVRVAVSLLGGTASSLLFKNVREKYSLCYYCAARYDRTSGVILIDSGVEEKNAERAKEEILLQLKAMQTGNFSEEEIVETQLVLKTALKGTTDSLSAMESWYLTQVLGGTEYSPNMEIELCNQVTKQDIVNAMNRVKLDTVYTLLPKPAENK